MKKEHLTVRTTDAHFSRERDTSSTHMRVGSTWVEYSSLHFLKSHLVVTCFIATCSVSLILFLSSLPLLLRNQAQLAPIHRAWFADWLNKDPSQKAQSPISTNLVSRSKQIARPAGHEKWEELVRRYERNKSSGAATTTLDDDTKTAALEAVSWNNILP